MLKGLTQEIILKRMMDRVLERYPDMDTRESSPLYNMLAPAAVELQLLYIELEYVLNEAFADTAGRESLIKKCAERGIYPKEATKAILRGEFNIDIPIGTRFSLDVLNYAVIGRISEGIYELECEESGSIGNDYFGALIPIDYIQGLTHAGLVQLLIPGEDEEETEHLRQRYFNSFKAQAFGGNVADYIEKVTLISGVGGVKVHKAWRNQIRPSDLLPPDSVLDWLNGNSSIPNNIKQWIDIMYQVMEEGLFTAAGTIQLVIVDSSWNRPTEALIQKVQSIIDPVQNQGEGVGIAPIGHVVAVSGVEEITMDIETEIAYRPGYEWEDIQVNAEEMIDGYFTDLAKEWADTDVLVVRISQIESKFLTIQGVLDVTCTKINGKDQNFVLGKNTIPKRGIVHG